MVIVAKYFSEWVSNTVNRFSPLPLLCKEAVYSEQSKLNKPKLGSGQLQEPWEELPWQLE